VSAHAVSELEALRASIERDAAAAEQALDPSAFPEHGPDLPGRAELCRQLAALRARVERAWSDTDDPAALRAELATLLFFAGTLRGDAEVWRLGVRQALAEIERQEAAAQRQRDRLAAQQAELARRRQALQARIDQEAGAIADQKRGECRRTLPVITLDPGLTVSSMTVSRSRGRFRSVKLWLVTLDEGRREVLVRPA
jgi:hypothetical protein